CHSGDLYDQPARPRRPVPGELIRDAQQGHPLRFELCFGRVHQVYELSQYRQLGYSGTHFDRHERLWLAEYYPRHRRCAQHLRDRRIHHSHHVANALTPGPNTYYRPGKISSRIDCSRASRRTELLGGAYTIAGPWTKSAKLIQTNALSTSDSRDPTLSFTSKYRPDDFARHNTSAARADFRVRLAALPQSRRVPDPTSYQVF